MWNKLDFIIVFPWTHEASWTTVWNSTLVWGLAQLKLILINLYLLWSLSTYLLTVGLNLIGWLEISIYGKQQLFIICETELPELAIHYILYYYVASIIIVDYKIIYTLFYSVTIIIVIISKPSRGSYNMLYTIGAIIIITIV